MNIYQFDLQYITKGIIIGIDEAGRGPLAGPVVSAAVILNYNNPIYDLNDSKKLSPEKRVKLFRQIIEKAEKIGIGIVDNRKIDEMNIYKATILSMQKALDSIGVEDKSVAIIDGLRFEYKGIETIKIVKGDTKSAAIMAASIIAKVTRDNLMRYYHNIYPNYLFSEHKGYPTKKHIEKIKEFGISPIHRKSFEPIKSLLNQI